MNTILQAYKAPFNDAPSATYVSPMTMALVWGGTGALVGWLLAR